MKITDKEGMSEWAYNQCKRRKKDREELMNLIDEDQWIYKYCKNIEDVPELWRKLKTPIWIFKYCLEIEDRPELRQKIRTEKNDPNVLF